MGQSETKPVVISRTYGKIDPARLGELYEHLRVRWIRKANRRRGGNGEDAVQDAMVLLLDGTVQVPVDATDEELDERIIRLARVLNRPGPRGMNGSSWATRPRVTRQSLRDAKIVQNAVDDVAAHPWWLWRFLGGDSTREIAADAKTDNAWVFRTLRRYVRELASGLPPSVQRDRRRWLPSSGGRVRALLDG